MVIEKIENYPASLKSLGSDVTLLFLHLMPAMSANSTELSCPYPQHRSVLTWAFLTPSVAPTLAQNHPYLLNKIKATAINWSPCLISVLLGTSLCTATGLVLFNISKAIFLFHKI